MIAITCSRYLVVQTSVSLMVDNDSWTVSSAQRSPSSHHAAFEVRRTPDKAKLGAVVHVSQGRE